MHFLRLTLCLIFFTTLFALVGDDQWGGHWPGVVGGALVGAFFGLVFGGAQGKWLDWFYPPGEDHPDQE
jgi:hypothetical protein